MSSDKQFTALGPAAVGFQTDSTKIERGVHAQGTTFGVDGYGGEFGVRGTGNSGVIGIGTSSADGAGGKFSSADLVPQLHLKPQLMAEPPPGKQPHYVLEFPKPQTLPILGRAGDFWLAQHDAVEHDPVHTCSLWLCVQDSVQGPTGITSPAMWRQVLLGGPYPGKSHPISH
jgi:hypothetical protein